MVKLSHIWLSFLAVLALLLLFDFIPGLFTEIEVSSDVRDIPKLQSLKEGEGKASRASFESKMELYEQWSDKKKSTEDKKPSEAAKPVVKIDKTVRPFFELFGEDYQIGLVGLFFERVPFAVVNKIKFADKQSSYHRLQVGEQLDGFKVTDINSEGITLDNGERAISLFLFNKESTGV